MTSPELLDLTDPGSLSTLCVDIYNKRNITLLVTTSKSLAPPPMRLVHIQEYTDLKYHTTMSYTLSHTAIQKVKFYKT